MTENLEQRARDVLGTIERYGLDFVTGGQHYAKHLQYGLDNRLVTQEKVDLAQKKYSDRAAKRH